MTPAHPSSTHDVDRGTSFGTWTDPTSRWLYRDSTEKWMTHLGLPSSALVADLGGANGLLRDHLPWAVTVDSDEAKEPDVVDDILTWTPTLSPLPEAAVVRYVLHYLTDEEVSRLLTTVATYTDTLYLVQFVNENIAAKEANSVNEPPRYFRTHTDLIHLIKGSPEWRADRCWLSPPYRVPPEFYANRLGSDPADHVEHEEQILAVRLDRTHTVTPSTEEARS